MSYETLVKEAQKLTYKEQIDLLAYLTASVKFRTENTAESDNISRHLNATTSQSSPPTDFPLN